VKLPEGADPWSFVVVEVASIAWRAVTSAMPGPHDRAVVVGQGMLGSFATWWLLHFGAQVIVVDRVAERLERSRRWGVTAAIDAREAHAVDLARSYFPDGADIAIEASASAAGIKLAGSLLRQNHQHLLHASYDPAALRGQADCWPRLVLLATYLDSVTIAPGDLFREEGAIVLRSADRRIGDRMSVVKRVADGAIRASDFVGEPVPYREAPDRYRELRDHPERVSSIAFRWKSE
jgi:threonine dehydrogenase-like Zn-dependent dehydrogenase